MQGSFDGSDLVVVGTVISGEEFRTLDSTSMGSRYFRYPQMRYRVVISEKFKGNFRSDTVTIITGMGHGDCGYQFGIGYEYIIYGYKQYKDRSSDRVVNFFETDICTRTRGASDLKKIQELRMLVSEQN